MQKPAPTFKSLERVFPDLKSVNKFTIKKQGYQKSDKADNDLTDYTNIFT